jgi:hypothetical protein
MKRVIMKPKTSKHHFMLNYGACNYNNFPSDVNYEALCQLGANTSHSLDELPSRGANPSLQ